MITITQKVVDRLYKIFRVSLRWAYLEMIRFWAPIPLGRGPQMGKIFDQRFKMGDIIDRSNKK